MIKYIVPDESFSTERYLLDHFPDGVVRFETFTTDGKTREEVIKFIEENGFPLRLIYNNHYVTPDNTCVISFLARYDSKNKFDVRYSFVHQFNHETFTKDIIKVMDVSDEDEGAEFNLITINNGRPRTVTKSLKKLLQIDKANSYNFNCTVDEILEDIKKSKSGLILFTGLPGTGKSSLIKWLAQQVPERAFFFLSNSNLHMLSDPAFADYCLENLEDCVLVLEDCETALMDRSRNASHDISNILNMTDGIIGDMLNITIIATINTTDAVDKALLRKGRLIRKVDFNKLKKEQVKELAQSLGFEMEPKEMVLTEVYNQASNGVEEKTNPVGFKL